MSVDIIKQKIQEFVSQPNYPCVAAVQSFHKGEYMIGSYSSLGSGQSAAQLGQDLLRFKKEQKERKSPYFSFWAVFPDQDSEFHDDEHFEKALWSELSAIVQKTPASKNWDPHFSSKPEDKNFCFSLDGEAFFIVGLHRRSDRRSRQFPFTAIAFNLYDQFRVLMDEKKFDPMVKINRLREMRFQGDLNPMVEKYGQDWEAIQFSGRKNSESWKCPFHHGKTQEA